MHLESLTDQTVTIPGTHPTRIHFTRGETIHTENSHKFTPESLTALLASASFTPTRTYNDPAQTFAVTLATAL